MPFFYINVVYVMCLVFVRFIFENKNNLVVKKQAGKQDSKLIYGFFSISFMDSSPFCGPVTHDVTSVSV